MYMFVFTGYFYIISPWYFLYFFIYIFRLASSREASGLSPRCWKCVTILIFLGLWEQDWTAQGDVIFCILSYVTFVYKGLICCTWKIKKKHPLINLTNPNPSFSCSKDNFFLYFFKLMIVCWMIDNLIMCVKHIWYYQNKTKYSVYLIPASSSLLVTVAMHPLQQDSYCVHYKTSSRLTTPNLLSLLKKQGFKFTHR